MNIYESTLTEEVLNTLISLSADWEAEGSCYGFRKNDRSDIEPNRIFLAEEDGEILGYLMGHREEASQSRSIMADGTPYFEIEELYVIPGCRSQGIGRQLYGFAEEMVKAEGIPYIMLSTATKNYKSILYFYIDEMGMEFWSARLYKKLF